MASRTLDELDPEESTLLHVEETSNSIKFNDVEHTEFTQLSQSEIDIILEDVEDPPSMTCCRACYIVHDLLNIHFIDCLCCLTTCPYNCGFGELVTYEIYD